MHAAASNSMQQYAAASSSKQHTKQQQAAQPHATVSSSSGNNRLKQQGFPLCPISALRMTVTLGARELYILRGIVALVADMAC